MKQVFSRIFSRVTLVGFFILVQLAALYVGIALLGSRVTYFYGLCRLAALLLVLRILYKNDNPAYKIAWIVPILLMPFFGGLLYLVFGKAHLNPREKARMRDVAGRYITALAQADEKSAQLEQLDPQAAVQSRYIRRTGGTPVFTRTETEYLPVGEAYYARLKEALEGAERFIFLEYYIIRPGKMWDGIHAILRQKAAQGVEVRLMYDDFGVMFKLPENTRQLLESEGIRVCVFNPLRPVLSVRFNNRDHRKICVVDGNIGFTGGVNISDEYINAAPRCGHWLDSGVCLRGEAVWALTVMFLSLWDFVRRENTEFSRYRPDPAVLESVGDDGFVQPFTDMPLDDEPVGETVYRNMIQRAGKYVYINTPYLIIDNEMITALSTAAKSGVDVRIVTPAICDSRLVQEMTRSYYEPLIQAGVKIYEYEPGMVHAKTFVCDDRYGVVGTINLDYRSLYLHYECAVWMCSCRAVEELKAAYLTELEACRPVTPDTYRDLSRLRHLFRAILRTLAPLF